MKKIGSIDKYIEVNNFFLLLDIRVIVFVSLFIFNGYYFNFFVYVFLLF